VKRNLNIFIASVGTFVGSLLADVVLGDGIQSDDMQQAAMVGIVAAGIQWWISRKSR
jgi:hypothetical protein